MTPTHYMTRSGTLMKFIALVPEANDREQLVLLDTECGNIETYWADGHYYTHRGDGPCSMDVTPVPIVTPESKEVSC